jgi:serine/threonine protein kinase
MFIEIDNFSIQTIINTYVSRELPKNTVNIINSGVCVNKKLLTSEKQGYNLMEEASLGDGTHFFVKLINKFYDNEFNINSNDHNRYCAIVNFLLQVVFIIGHLQSSPLEFFHGDFKPDNVFVSKSDKTITSHFAFKVFGKEIKIKNLGFAVLIADFDKSSITIEDENNPKKYRIIPPIEYKPLFTSAINNIIKKYGDIDPDNIKNTEYEKTGVKIEKIFFNNLVPKKMDTTLIVLRSAGVKLYRDFDLYTFFIKLIFINENIKTFCLEKNINNTIMSFMSKAFLNSLYSKKIKVINMSESAYIAIEIFGKINENMINVFTDEYIGKLQELNYRLFK